MDAGSKDASIQPVGFANAARGKASQPLDLDLARINADVYAPAGSRIANWFPIPEAQLAAAGIRASDLENRHAGFRARFYTDGAGHYVLAFCGTNEGKDWKHNIRQGLGLEDVQYEMAIALSRKARVAFGEELVLTGHSLGGGLASIGAIAIDAPAVTFNSAGLHDKTIERLDFDADAVRRELARNGQIRRYAVDGEILTSLQEERLLTRALMPDAIGHRIDLPDPDPVRGWKRLIPGSGLRHGVEIHGMDAVLESQELTRRATMDDAGHPAHGLYRQALDRLQGIPSNALGYQVDDDYRNAAGSLAAQAREAGLGRIDHVVVGANGSLFAVEGPLEDARHRIASVDRTHAALQPLEETSRRAAVARDGGGTSDTPYETQHRSTALLP